MEQQGITLKEKRDFSDVLNASFRFIKDEFKPLFGTVFMYTVIPLVGLGILSVFNTTNSLNYYFEGIVQSNFEVGMPNFWIIGLILILSILSHILILGITYEYMAAYYKYGKGNFTTSDIIRAFANDFFAIIGYTFITVLVMFFAFAFFLIPGIYISVPLSLIIIVKVVERNGFSASWGRSFKLIKNNWWITFAIILIAYIIIYTASALFGIPASVYVVSKGLTALKEANTEFDKIPFGIFNIISTVGTYMLYIILYVIIGFQYFSLSASQDSDTIIDRINKIGKTEEES